MKILCPQCSTPYSVPDASIGPDGRMVRCARCGASWRAMAAEDIGAVPAPPAEAAIAPTDIALAPAAGPQAAPPAPVLTLPAEAPSRRPPPLEARMVGRAASPPRRRSRILPHVAGPLALAAALALTVAAVVWREPIVGTVHDLAGLYRLAGLDVNLRGLEFRDVTAARTVENGAPVLLVAGKVANVAPGEVDLPGIRIALRSAAAEEVYAWSVELGAPRLAAGDSVPFRTRVASPPDARDIELRFADRRPATAAVAVPGATVVAAER